MAKYMKRGPIEQKPVCIQQSDVDGISIEPCVIENRSRQTLPSTG